MRSVDNIDIWLYSHFSWYWTQCWENYVWSCSQFRSKQNVNIFWQRVKQRPYIEIPREWNSWEKRAIPYLINSFSIFFTDAAVAAAFRLVCRWTMKTHRGACVYSLYLLVSDLENDEFSVSNLLVYSSTHLRSSVLLYLYLIHSKSARVVKIIFHSHSSSHSNNPHTLAYVCLLFLSLFEDEYIFWENKRIILWNSTSFHDTFPTL